MGLIFLLLFHPMSTIMERLQIMENSKLGKIPRDFEKDYPKIADLIRRMLSKDPIKRPTLEVYIVLILFQKILGNIKKFSSSKGE